MPGSIDAAFLAGQHQFSLDTFGPGLRTEQYLRHIGKELLEIEAEPVDLSEWADVILLALGAALRVCGDPQTVIDVVRAKLERNMARTWPDWRTADPGQPIEHDRGGGS